MKNTMKCANTHAALERYILILERSLAEKAQTPEWYATRRELIIAVHMRRKCNAALDVYQRALDAANKSIMDGIHSPLKANDKETKGDKK